MELYKLAANCEYKAMEEEMIRDRLVVGIRDISLSQTLQLDPELTLESAKKKVRQREAVHEQQQVLKNTQGTTELEEVQTRRGPRRPNSNRTNTRPSNNKPKRRYAVDAAKIHTPGTNVQPRTQPVIVAKRRAIIVPNVFQRACSISELQSHQDQLQGEDYLDTAYLDTNTCINSNGKSIWTTKIQLCGTETVFKLDTGAEVTAISDQTFHTLLHKPQLNTPEKILRGPSSCVLEVKPFSLYTSRNVPLPLRGKVKDELDKMESMGVISKIEEATEWCAGMVVVPKREGKVRI